MNFTIWAVWAVLALSQTQRRQRDAPQQAGRGPSPDFMHRIQMRYLPP